MSKTKEGVYYFLDHVRRKINVKGVAVAINPDPDIKTETIDLDFSYDGNKIQVSLSAQIKFREGYCERFFFPEVTECLKIARDELMDLGLIQE